jgi:hypothetical protein
MKLRTPKITIELWYNSELDTFHFEWCPMCGEGKNDALSKWDMLSGRCYICGFTAEKLVIKRGFWSFLKGLVC